MAKGLEGIIASQSSISSIIDDQLTYVGYNIDELVEHSTFEEIVYLLWHRRLPNEVELQQFKSDLAKNYALPNEVIAHFSLYSMDGVHPMSALRTAVSLLCLYDEESENLSVESNFKKAVSLQAKVGSLVAAFSRIRKGLLPIAPREDLGYAANFLYMLNAKVPTELEVKAFDKALILHADHEFNASTFTARVCVATLSDMYSGLTAAIGALKGPLHGGANEAVMSMLFDIGSLDNVEKYLEERIANKEKIMGFGHRVYRYGDPRAKHLKEMSQKLTAIIGQPHLYEMSEKLEKLVWEAKQLPPNVDFYSATVYHALGIDHDLFTPIFAVSRMSGWIAHILEQYENNRLIRPRAEYTGPGLRSYVPMSER